MTNLGVHELKINPRDESMCALRMYYIYISINLVYTCTHTYTHTAPLAGMIESFIQALQLKSPKLSDHTMVHNFLGAMENPFRTNKVRVYIHIYIYVFMYVHVYMYMYVCVYI